MSTLQALLEAEYNRFSQMSRSGKADLHRIGIAIAGEDRFGTAIRRLLLTAMLMTHADGGTLYIKRDDHLVIQLMANRSLQLLIGNVPGNERKIPLYKKKKEPNDQYMVVRSFLTKSCLNTDHVNQKGFMDFQGPKSFDLLHKYHTHSVLSIPLIHKKRPWGVLQLINALNNGSPQPRPFTKEEQDLVIRLCAETCSKLHPHSGKSSIGRLVSNLFGG